MVTIQQWWRTGIPSAGERQARRGPEPHLVQENSAAEATPLQAGRAGDRAALEQLLALHKRPLCALCRGMLGDADDAEDAVQETFLHALRALSTLRGDSAFRSWLFRIAINICLEWKAAIPPPPRGKTTACYLPHRPLRPRRWRCGSCG